VNRYDPFYHRILLQSSEIAYDWFEEGFTRIHGTSGGGCMTSYGIKLVWAGWNNDTVIGFSERGYKRWRDKLEPGTRMLLYETTGKPKGSKAKGTKSIVGEVEVMGSFDDGEALRSPTEQHDRVLPVKVIRARDAQPIVPLARVRAILADEQYPRMGESWRPLTLEEYEAFIKEWA
jgi:hypothetical protein